MKFYIRIIPFILCLFSCLNLFSQTYVNGSLEKDTTWTPSGNPYIVESLLISEFAKLQIEPGCTVRAESSSSFIYIWGKLEAIGTKTKRIKFDSITIIEEAYPYDLKDTLRFVNCDFNGFSKSSNLFNLHEPNLSLKNCTIIGYNTIATFFPNSYVKLDSCTIINSHNSTFASPRDVQCPVSEYPTLEIRNSTITRGRFEQIGDVNLQLINNMFYDLDEVSLNGSFHKNLQCNTFKKIKHGVILNVLPNPNKHAICISKNTFDSIGGVNNLATSLVLAYPADGTLYENFSENNFLSNLSEGYLLRVSPSWRSPSKSATLNFQNNYWGTTDPYKIADQIKTYNEGNQILGVDFGNLQTSIINNNCSTSQSCIAKYVGISKEEIQSTLIHPNPSSNSFQVRSSKPVDEVSVFSNTGQLILQVPYKSNELISTGDSAPNMYIVVIRFSTGQTVFRKLSVVH